MKKSRLKRFGLGLLQHMMAAGIMMAVAGLMLNSNITVESIEGTKVYKIFPINTDQEFEDSEIYHDLFRNAVSDITQLVVIKGQLETNDVFDPSKKIDVTEYAREIGADDECAVTAVYELDDIIKWGKYGVEYSNRIMSMSEFVNYFGYCIYPENFMLDEYGQLHFDDFYRVEDIDEEQENIDGEPEAGDAPEVESPSVKSEEELSIISERLGTYTEEQLEDLVLSHIMTMDLEGVEMYREDDGRLTVFLPMLNCRYATVTGEKQLTALADNWVDYVRLQNNVVASINNLTVNYQQYQVFNEAYAENNSNVKYMVRMMTDSGMCTYTNVSQVKEFEDADVTEFFSEYRRYLIYYPDSLVFMGNTILGEEEIDDYISLYDYAYPDTTHIWIGVDTNYAIEGDAFQNANAVYQKIVPNVNRILGIIALLAVIWLGLGIYLTLTAGIAIQEDGKKVLYLNRLDRIWTEVAILLGVGLGYAGVIGYGRIIDITENVGVIPMEMFGISLTRIYQYGVFALFGIYVSLAFDIFWYSLVRRIKVGNLWEDSLLHKICTGIVNFLKFVIRHKNSAISTLLPYNLFLFFNLAGIVVVYTLLDTQRIRALIILIVMVIVDCAVGVVMFRRRAEQIEIVDGINRIRDGEVEFKLDAESLHGSNKELADAVNNIGEGIRKAVKTSMKDEQMKTDLITNVSHDIKTPLTSIINYVDLLKRLKITEEPAKGYITILDGKAQRLKQLTDDLVEASKISSGNIVLNKEKLNLTELINQSIGEFSEKLEESGLQVVFEDDDIPAYIFADSRRMWRVVENLFNNICKYALEGTRVYIDLIKEDGQIEVSIKNISKQQMNIRPDELTERFIRGDSSRTTEGSGLGLSIAKSLVQVHGGSFEIILDGDLFKIVIVFPEYVDSEPEEVTAPDEKTEA